jgi:hypothetical protein
METGYQRRLLGPRPNKIVTRETKDVYISPTGQPNSCIVIARGTTPSLKAQRTKEHNLTGYHCSETRVLSPNSTPRLKSKCQPEGETKIGKTKSNKKR